MNYVLKFFMKSMKKELDVEVFFIMQEEAQIWL